MDKLFENLTEEQKKIVLHKAGYALVLAGAGTGKTRVLTHRVVYLIKKLRVKPENIMTVTFTNKAADEMRERIKALLGKSTIRPMWIGTFHALCLRIVKKNALKLGYKENISIYDREDQKRIIKDIVKGNKTLIQIILSRISKIKTGFLKAANSEEEEIISKYNEELRIANALDFDDILLKCLFLLNNFPDIRERYAKKFQHILVDEFQDTNRIQYLILKQLSSKHRNLFVVGDEDQSIYTFRGAVLENILNFDRDFKDAKIYKLEENFRSTGNILKSASSLISRNFLRKNKNLWTKEPCGEKIIIYETEDELEEGEKVVEIVQNEKVFKNFLVLYRTNAQSRVLEQCLLRANIPYKVIGGIHFFDRKEIKDILAYLWLLINPKDDISFKRVVNVPPRGIGEKTIEIIKNYAREQKKGMLEFCMQNLNEIKSQFSEKSFTALANFTALIREFQFKLDKIPVDILLKQIIESISYIEYIDSITSIEEKNNSRKDNVLELIRSAEEFSKQSEDKSVLSYLSSVSLKTDADEYNEKLNVLPLLTVHNAKGLEAKYVIVTGMEDGTFPHKASFKTQEEMEEERRLFYVALTRAKEKVFLLYSRKRYNKDDGFLEPSRFLYELPEDAVDWEGRLDKTPKILFNKGNKVFHPKFGEGYIQKIFDGKAEIIFRDIGIKTIVLRRAKGLRRLT